MIKNIGRNVDILHTMWTCFSGFWRVAVTYYLPHQTLHTKVTLKICDGTIFYEQLKTDIWIFWTKRSFRYKRNSMKDVFCYNSFIWFPANESYRVLTYWYNKHWSNLLKSKDVAVTRPKKLKNVWITSFISE